MGAEQSEGTDWTVPVSRPNDQGREYAAVMPVKMRVSQQDLNIRQNGSE